MKWFRFLVKCVVFRASGPLFTFSQSLLGAGAPVNPFLLRAFEGFDRSFHPLVLPCWPGEDQVWAFRVAEHRWSEPKRVPGALSADMLRKVTGAVVSMSAFALLFILQLAASVML